MANVPYIAAGQDYSHEKWNTLWTEFDRKLGLLLDGKSPYFVDSGTTLEGLVGNVFYFRGAHAAGPNLQTGVYPAYHSFTPYDHSVYTAAAAALVETLRDEALQIMETGRAENVLSRSLEAHKRIVESGPDGPRRYWLWPTDSTVPEKRYRYGVAELVCDGLGDVFEIPAAWDKYNFFRIHNVSETDLTVRFRGTDEAGAEVTRAEVMVAKRGCLCVRRDSVNDGYDAALRYFWTVKTNDPRFLAQVDLNQAFTTEPEASKEIYASQRANNVANPALLFRWIQTYERRAPTTFGEILWYRDPHAVYDLGTYNQTLADANDPNAIVGNLIHHKGKFRVRRSDNTSAEIQFDGYETLRAKLLEAGLDLVESATNVAISAPPGPVLQELLAYGTNLLQGAGSEGQYAPATVVSLDDDYALDARWPDDAFQAAHDPPQLFSLASASETVEGVTYIDDSGVEQLGGVRTLYGVGTRPIFTAPPAMRIWRDTIGSVVSLRNFYNAVDLSTGHRYTPQPDGTVIDEQLTNLPVYTSFEEAHFVTTIFGPELHYKMRVRLEARIDGFLMAEVLEDGLTEIVAEAGGTYAIQKKVIAWPPVGWPTPDAPGFFTPRLTRRYSQRPVIDPNYARHPDIINEEVGIDGADFDLEPVGESYEASEITALCPATLERSSGNGRGNFGVWKNPDELGIEMGAHSSREFHMPRVFMLSEIYNTMAAWVNALKKAKPVTFENSRFYFGPQRTFGLSQFASPRDLYCWIDGPGFMAPDGTMLAGTFREEAVFTEPAKEAQVTFEPGSAVGTVEIFDLETEQQPVFVGQVVGLTSGWYLSIATVQAYAESLGFKFKLELATTPIGTKQFDLEGITAVESREGIPGGAVFDFGLHGNVVFHSEDLNPTTQDLKWKTDFTDTISSGSLAGNKLYGGGQVEGNNWWRVAFDVNEMVRNYAVGDLISPVIFHPRNVLVQNYVSAGMQVETVALLTPERTFRHIGEDHSGASWEGFINAHENLSRALPLGGDANSGPGPARLHQCVNGDTLVKATDPQNAVALRILNTVSLA
jgi:hypothetical protein